MSAELTARDIIDLLDLAPLEGEGGFFRETWVRPAEHVEQPEATCIYYLITPESFSALHRLRHDEIFHFYLGDPCRSVMMNDQGEVQETILGHGLRSGMQVQHLVSAGTWQATTLLEGGRFALLGTTMSPGFHISGFELATPALLQGLAPDAQDVIRSVLAGAGHP